MIRYTRKDGQNSVRDMDKRDLRAELEEKERKHYTKKRYAVPAFPDWADIFKILAWGVEERNGRGFRSSFLCSPRKESSLDLGAHNRGRGGEEVLKLLEGSRKDAEQRLQPKAVDADDSADELDDDDDDDDSDDDGV
eukprot:1184840-Prorocentrum_minimum.AAC.3